MKAKQKEPVQKASGQSTQRKYYPVTGAGPEGESSISPVVAIGGLSGLPRSHQSTGSATDFARLKQDEGFNDAIRFRFHHVKCFFELGELELVSGEGRGIDAACF